jgi:hypothetical protein
LILEQLGEVLLAIASAIGWEHLVLRYLVGCASLIDVKDVAKASQ